MSELVPLNDPHGLLSEFNDDPPTMAEVRPDIAGQIAKISDRVAQGRFLEPYFFHPDPAIQRQAAEASVFVDVSKLTDYLVHLMATGDDVTAAVAARAIWQRHPCNPGEYAVESLAYQAERFGRTKARRTAERLLQNAPNPGLANSVRELLSERELV